MTVQILNEDVMVGLGKLADESVHAVVTSPPYWGLRDYGAEGQIGLEPTLQEHIAKLVEVFRAVRRVLRADGTVWLNYGDAFAGSGRGGNPTESTSTLQGGQTSQRASMVKRARRHDEIGATSKAAAQTNTARRRSTAGLHSAVVQSGAAGRSWCPPTDGFKNKDLMLMPERLAIALCDDGWYIRSRIIWHKPNPLPESVTDRPTKSHEHIWLLSKSPRYFYDAEAIKEPASFVGPNSPRSIASPHGQGFTRRARGNSDGFRGGSYVDGEIGSRKGVGNVPAGDLTRNCRDVWTIATAPFGEAHFATFPPELAERCVKAGCPVGGTILDPFGGAGTTGLVADRLQRNAVLIEINPDFAAMAERRIRGDAPLLAEASVT